MYKTIILPIEGVEEAKAQELTALTIGHKFGSHIKGLRVTPTLQSLQSISDHHYVSFEIYDQILKNQIVEIEKDREAFIKILDVSGLEYEWIVEEGDFLRSLKKHASTADLAIVNQGNDEIGDVMGDIPSFILDSGIPTLAVPKNVTEGPLAQNIFIAWNGGKEAIHAVHAALPLLKEAKEVTVLSVAEEKKDEIILADICKFLGRHGVNVKGMTEPLHFDPGSRILEICLENGADLIVAGAWAHSRFAELIYGGTTRLLYNNQQIPVLFAH